MPTARRETAFHRVTYAEADALRARAKLASTGPRISDTHPRLCCDYTTKTPMRSSLGPRCRECGRRIGTRADAIKFLFEPHYGDDEHSYYLAEGWLHIKACPGGRA